MLCRVLQVSRSGYYEWCAVQRANAPRKNAEFDAQVRAVFAASRGRYGSRRIQAELNAKGIECSRTRVAASMRRSGLRAKKRRKFKATTDSNHNKPIAPNRLERDFSPDGPNEAWVGDITYIWTTEGWLYLAVLIDLWSRRVVGYATSERIDRHLVLDALRMATGLRGKHDGLVAHTDRGSQYASADYQAALRHAGFVCSMSRKGNCWDNAPAESFFSTLKTEAVFGRVFRTRADAHAELVEYIVWYNAERRHSTLGGLAPAQFEALSTQSQLAA